MATSGSSDFAMTRNEIIRAAARKINAVRSGATMGNAMIKDFDQALNAMVKQWQVEGLHVWTVTEATLFPQAGQIQYPLSNAVSSANATQQYTQTEISADEPFNQTVISVASTEGISNGDKIGITLDNGQLHWTTVSGAPSTTVTIAAPLPDSASAGKLVFAYTNRIVRPLKIVDARSYDPVSREETPIDIIARHDYRQLSNKFSLGTQNQMFYDPQLNVGQLWLYQSGATVGNLVNFTWHRPIQDFDAAGNNPDLPQEWIQTIIFNLAVVMAPEFEVSATVMSGPHGVGTLADRYLSSMRDASRGDESFEFGPDFDG